MWSRKEKKTHPASRTLLSIYLLSGEAWAVIFMAWERWQWPCLGNHWIKLLPIPTARTDSKSPSMRRTTQTHTPGTNQGLISTLTILLILPTHVAKSFTILTACVLATAQIMSRQHKLDEQISKSFFLINSTSPITFAGEGEVTNSCSVVPPA